MNLQPLGNKSGRLSGSFFLIDDDSHKIDVPPVPEDILEDKSQNSAILAAVQVQSHTRAPAEKPGLTQAFPDLAENVLVKVSLT
jgi:hypothetical protein